MDLVTVGTYNSAAAAEMAKNFLMDEGIQAFVEEGATGDMLHLGGEVKLQVAAKDAEQPPIFSKPPSSILATSTKNNPVLL